MPAVTAPKLIAGMTADVAEKMVAGMPKAAARAYLNGRDVGHRFIRRAADRSDTAYPDGALDMFATLVDSMGALLPKASLDGFMHAAGIRAKKHGAGYEFVD